MLTVKIDEKIIKILQLIRELSHDERIAVFVREEYMDKVSDIIEGKQ